MNPARLKAYSFLFITSIIWAVASPVIKFTLSGLSPLLFLFYRFGISAILGLFVLMFFRLKLPQTLKEAAFLLVYAFLTSTVALGLLFLGMDKTTVLDSTLITIILPLMVTVAGVVFLHEHVTKREKLGMAIAVTGMGVTLIEPFLALDGGVQKFSGNLLIFAYLVFATITSVMVKKLLRAGYQPAALANFSFIIGFLSLIPLVLLTYSTTEIVDSLRTLELKYQLGVFYMAVLSGTLAYTFSNKGQKTIEIGEAAVFSYLYPLLSVPIAVVWLKEKITPLFILGSIIIALGVAIAEIKKKSYNTLS
jgi:drug/metabolite transporter (DMT)-like permease